MAEAAVSGTIQEKFENKIEELKGMLDFVRELKIEERSRLKDLMADLVKLAQGAMDMGINDYRTRNMFEKVTKMQMINFGADEKNIGDEKEEEVVVGLEKDIEKLLEKIIFKESRYLQILCIKGMIGIGKTTLARQLYKAKAKAKAGTSQFQHRAWVFISSDMSHREILMKLIQQIVVRNESDPSLEEMGTLNLERMLRQHLVGKSYFIVLDNMSNEAELKSILKCLPSRGLIGSSLKLLLTSRYEIKTTNVHYTHEMKALDSDKSWQLFMKTIDRVTGVENKFSKDLEKKGKEKLKECGGVPIAIIDVARQKAKERLSGMEWEQLFDSIDLSESLKSLEPMYQELGEELKPHFLHLSFFKENAIIREEKLEKIWAANGLSSGSVVRDFADGSIFEVVKQYFTTKKCRLNPLLHMISIQKAKEKICFEILRRNDNSRPSQHALHRVIHFGREKFYHFRNEDSKQLISLIFHGGGSYLDDTSSSYWESLKLLKILDMEDFGLKTLFKEIGGLIELRYLGLRNNYIQKIPRSLGGLKKLEALDIAQNFMVEVPDIIKEMDGLRDLHMSNVICSSPLQVDALKNLETLTYISIYDWAYDDSQLEKMFNLRTLGIEAVDENSDVGNLFETLAKLPSFDNLFIRGFRFRSMPCLDKIGVIQSLETLKLDGHIGRLPSADKIPQGIMRITLVNTCLDEDPMPILEKFTRLSYLKLRNAYSGQQMVIRQGGFPMLKVLSINELWNLEKIQVDDGAMSSLRNLEINSCPFLETPPEQIKRMPELQNLTMVTTKHVATKVGKTDLTSKILEVDIYP